MFRLVSLAAVCTALLFAAVETTQAGQYGTPEEAKAMLEKAVAAMKQDKAKALDMFNKGEGGFKDRDLYVSCANASDGIVTAHPYLKGEQLKDIKGKKGYPLGQEMMEKATEGTGDGAQGRDRTTDPRIFSQRVSGGRTDAGPA